MFGAPPGQGGAYPGGRKTAGDGIDNPYRVEGRLDAEPQVAAASQRQPGARIDKPFRLGADGGGWHPRPRSNRWRSKAMSDAFAPGLAHPPPNRQPTDPSPPRGRYPRGGTILEYGASAVFPRGGIPATDPQGRAPAFGRLANYGSRVFLVVDQGRRRWVLSWTSTSAGAWPLGSIVGSDRMGRRRNRRTPG